MKNKAKNIQGRRIFQICDLCQTPVYKITDQETGKEIFVNAMAVKMDYPEKRYGIKINFLYDPAGNRIYHKKKYGFMNHEITCQNRRKNHVKI